MDSQLETDLEEQQRLYRLLQYAFKKSSKLVKRKITIYCPVKQHFVDYIDKLRESNDLYFNAKCNKLLYKEIISDVRSDIRSIRWNLDSGRRMSKIRFTSMCNNNNAALYSALYTLKQLLLKSVFPQNKEKQENMEKIISELMDVLFYTQDINSVQSVYLKTNPLLFQVLANTCEDRLKFLSKISFYLGYDMTYPSRISRYYARRKRAYKEWILFDHLLFN